VNLHRRLTVTMALLLVVGLAVADVVTYSSLRSFLYGRLDAQIDSSQALAARYLTFSAHAHRVPTAERIDERVSPDVYVLVLNRRGHVLVSRPSGSPALPDPMPVVPRSVRAEIIPPPLTFGKNRGAYRPNPDGFDLSGPTGSGTQYRAQALRVPQGTLITAISLNPTEATLSSVLRVELLVSLGVLLLLCGLALWTVRRGLRPLDDMTRAADAIGSGDLTRRVGPVDDRTEVGRLGIALNAMLSQIESAFGEKSASEARLRQFVADASHELRTPLTSIRGYAELLRKGAVTDEEGRRRALARVESEAARMSGLVDDLLLLARLDQGRPLGAGPVELRRIVRDAVDDARTAEPDRPLTLVAPSPVTVAGDRDRLAQVAHNLVRNALSHTPPGTAVRVSVWAQHGMGVIQVSDEGLGLDPARAAQVFDRFYRGDASRSSEGTGLGLAIVRAIAVSSGGDAWVTSTPGSGAVFTVEIPLVDQEPTVPPASSPSVGTSDAVGESPPEAGERRDGVGPAPVPPDGAEHRRQFTG
jgi:two-component system, OmpR family, sensor kinase